MDERINQLAEEVTTGLQADPELRLDVKAELITHLERTAEAFREEGTGEEKAGEQALKVFGSPVELAGELLQANKRRMKLRALARLAVQALLLPVAVAASVWLGYGGLLQIQDSYPQWLYNQYDDFIDGLSSDGTAADIPKPYFYIPTMSDLPRLPGLPSMEERLKHAYKKAPSLLRQNEVEALFRKHPDNKMYAGYSALRDYSDNDGHDFTAFRARMRRRELADPDNALYHYLAAYQYLNAAMKQLPWEKRTKTYAVLEYSIVDPQLAAEGIDELRKGMAKASFTSYHFAIFQERFSLLPKPQRLADHMDRIGMMSHELLPEFAFIRELARKSPHLAEFLLSQGKRDEALYLLQFCHRLSLQLLHDHDDVIILKLAIAKAVAELGARMPASMAENLGQHELAHRFRAHAQQFRDPFIHRRQFKLGNQRTLIQHGGALAYTLIPPFVVTPDEIPLPDLAPSRRLDHIMLEQCAASLFQLLMAVVMLVTLCLQVYWFFRSRAVRGGFLLLPSFKVSLRIFATGILLPLAVYVIYTRWSGLAGREYGMLYMGWRFVAEMWVLLFTIAFLPRRLVLKHIRTRCRSLHVPIPPSRAERKRGKPRERWSVAGAFRALFGGLPLRVLLVRLLLTFGIAWGMAFFSMIIIDECIPRYSFSPVTTSILYAIFALLGFSIGWWVLRAIAHYHYSRLDPVCTVLRYRQPFTGARLCRGDSLCGAGDTAVPGTSRDATYPRGSPHLFSRRADGELKHD